MKKIKSILAFLMFGTLTLSGCSFVDFFKKKDKGNDTPADTGGGGSEEGGGGEHTEVKFTVTFNVQGHGTAPASVEVDEGGKVTKPTDPSADGWTFGGWFKEEACTNAWNFANDTVTADVTLYAKWTENGGGEVTKYTVTFDVQDHGEAPTSVEVDEGGKVTKPTDPSATGWTFDGWFKEAACTNAWDFANDTVTANVTLYAKWTENAEDLVSVTFNLQGHGENWHVAVKPGETVSKPETDPSASGYTFGGWFKEESCTTPFDFTEAISADTVIYAKWTEDTPPAPSDKFVDKVVLKGLEGDWTTGKKGIDATDPDDVTEGKYLEQVKFTFSVGDDPEEVKILGEDIDIGYNEVEAECKSLAEDGDNHNIRLTGKGDYELYAKKHAESYSVWIEFDPAEPPVVDVHKLVINRVGEDEPIEVNLTLQTASTTEYKVEGQQLQVNDEFVMVVGTTTYKYADLKLGEGEGHVGGGVQDLFEEATDGSIKVKAAHKYNLYVETAESGKGIYTFAAYFQYQEPEGEWLTPDISLKVDPLAEDPITEYVIGQDTPIHLAAGTKFLFRIGENWYKFADLKSGVTGINDDGEGNLLTTVAGDYTIYCETVADGEGHFIYVVCDADPVELNAKLVIGSSEIALDVKNTTEYYKEGVELTAGDEFIFEINDESYGYDLLKTSGVPQLFEEGSSDNKLKAKVSGEFDLYCETVASEDPMLRIHIQPSNDSLVYCNGAKTAWYMETLTHDEEEHQYPATSKSLEKGARVYFCVGGVFTQTTENIEESSPVKSWFSDTETGLAVSVSGTYDFFYKESGSLYVDGTLDAASNYVEILRAATPTAPAEHETVSLKVESAVTYYNEIYHQANLKAGDKIRFMVNGDWLDEISESTAKASFVDADENHYFEVKTGEEAVYNFYARFLGDDQGFWVVKYVAPTAVAYKLSLHTDGSWNLAEADSTGDGVNAVYFAWVWKSDLSGRWVELPAYVSEYGDLVIYVNLLSDDIGMKVCRINGIHANAPTDGLTPYGEHTDEAIWNYHDNIVLPGSTATINVNF